MPALHDIDGVLIQWGERLFYPGNRIVKSKPQPKLSALSTRQRAAAVRERIQATAVRRAPQVMVKVTGGGRGMKAIAALPLHQQERPARDRGRAGQRRSRQGRGPGTPRGLALRWLLDPRREPAPRGLQRDPVDACGHRSGHGSARRPGFREQRVRRPQVRDGPARPSGQSARPPEPPGRVQARQAAEPAQG